MPNRLRIRDFELANRLYAGAEVTFWGVTAGVKNATRITLYEAITGVAVLSNPQRLNSLGRLKQAVYIEDSTIATITGVTFSAHDTGIIYNEVDAVAAVNAALTAHLADTVDAHDASAISYAGGAGLLATDVEAAIDELATDVLDAAWTAGPAPTYVSATQFTLVGNQTAIFTVGRRVRIVDSGGTKYGSIRTSVFAALTTITLDQDSSALATPLTSVSYGLDNPAATSLPVYPDTLAVRGGSADESKKYRVETDTNVPVATTVVGTIPSVSGTHSWTTEPTGLVQFPAMWMQGLVPSNNAGDAVNDLDFTAGQCRDDTNVRNIVTAALTKRSDATFVVGTNQGMLDTGAIADGNYDGYDILRTDTGITDKLCCVEGAAPSMPSGYTLKRRTFWFKRVAGTIVAFKAIEIEGGGLGWLWTSPTLDINLANTLTTARRTDAVKVPLTFSVMASLNVQLNDAVTGYDVWIYSPDQADLAPSLGVTPLSNIRSGVAAATSQQMDVRTSAAGTIAARSNLATVDLYAVSTMGFEWSRRNT